mgnify:CR=1 FL=1
MDRIVALAVAVSLVTSGCLGGSKPGGWDCSRVDGERLEGFCSGLKADDIEVVHLTRQGDDVSLAYETTVDMDGIVLTEGELAGAFDRFGDEIFLVALRFDRELRDNEFQEPWSVENLQVTVVADGEPRFNYHVEAEWLHNSSNDGVSNRTMRRIVGSMRTAERE